MFSMQGLQKTVEEIALTKALEAGNYNVSPDHLVQGAALQREDLSVMMQNVCYDDKSIVLQKMIRVEPCKGQLVQFNRQLSYGIFGGSALPEGAVGVEETSEYVRDVVPMCYYAHIRRVTLAANMVESFDGVKAEDREAASAAMKIAGDVEFDLFRGKADFTTLGVFDGNPSFIPALPNMLGLDVQIRQSDFRAITKDSMFNSYGSNASNIIPAGTGTGGALTQANLEDAHIRASMNHGSADIFVLDPIALGNYNKIALSKERIIIAGTPNESTGSSLKRQWVSGGTVDMQASRFLSGKTAPLKTRAGAPLPPTIAAASVTIVGTTTPFIINQQYTYYVTSENPVTGESAPSNVATVTVAAGGDSLQVTITPPGGAVTHFNVYRTLAGAPVATAKFVGRIINFGATPVFIDLGNKIPGFSTGFLVQGDTMMIKELCPYSRMPLAVSDLSKPEAHFRFCTIVVPQPRKNVLIDNLV